ncbi:MAG: CvpA family protein [Clostridia bacterium]|nr:CvpA family protein [Clostridia bacterium]
MTPSLLNLILWAPFLLVLLISGLIFCISGYKKGLWRSLISLGVTIVSAAISMLLANVLAKVIAPSVVALVPMEDVVKDIPISPDTVAQIIGGLIGSVISLVLFVMLMFVLTLILKLVSNAIKRRALITTQKGYKLGGLGVRFVDAVLYTILLLLPIYGSIQAYAPTVQSLLSFVQTEDNEEMADIKEYVEVLASHPVVMMTKPSPIAAVYKGLQSFEVGDAVVNIPEIVETAKTTVSMLEDLSKKDITELGKEDLEIIDHLRDNVVDQDWFYAVADEGIKALKEQIPADSDDEYMQMLLPLLDMDKDSFKENCTALLDIAELLIKHDIINMMQKDEIDVVKLYESGCISEALRIVNGSNQLLAIKSMVIEKVVTELFGEDKAKADEFLKTLKLEKLETEEQLKKEAEAIGVLVMNQSSATILELIARHPMFTDRSLDMILDNFPMSEMLGFSGVLGEFVDTAEMTATLKSKLEECSGNAFNELHFGDYAEAIEAVDAYYSGEYYNSNGDVFSKGGEAMEYALELLKGHIKSNYQDVDVFKENILKLAIDSANEKAFASGENYIYILDALNSFIHAAWERSITLDMMPSPPTDEELSYLNTILSSDKGCAMLKQMCASKSDPLSLNLDPQQKAFVNKAIEALKAKYDEYDKLAEERKALDEAIRRGEDIRSEFSDGKIRYYDSKGNLLYEEEMDISIGGGSFEYGEYEGDMNGDLDIKYEYGDLGDGFDVGSVNGDSAFSGSFGGSFIISGVNSFEKPQNLDANLQSLLKFLGV